MAIQTKGDQMNSTQLKQATLITQELEQEARKLALLTMSPLAHISQKQQIARKIDELYELRLLLRKGN